MGINQWKQVMALMLSLVLAGTSICYTDVQVKAQSANGRIARFTFDDMDTGFLGDNAMAVNSGTAQLSSDAVAGNALYFDGQGSNYLTITDTEGASLLTGSSALSISYWSKITAAARDVDRAFYMAPDDNAQTYQNETCLGIKDSDSVVTAERYKNTGKLPANAIAAEKITGWKHITVVFDEVQTKIYVNGVCISAEASAYALTDILGENSVFYIGKANWDTGRFFLGLIDEVSVYNYALTETEIKDIYTQGAGFLDEKSARMVMDMIGYIGAVNYDSMSQTMINLARGAYDALTETQKAKVTNYAVLTDAENTYNGLAAAYVTELIAAIGEVTEEDVSRYAIEDARMAYDALTDAQKSRMASEQMTFLENAENTYYTMITDAKTAEKICQVIRQISAIGDIRPDEVCENRILSAEAAYEALTAEQQDLVSNYSTMQNARLDYAYGLQSEKEKADAKAAQEVMNCINRIGNVNTGEVCKAKIETAENAYNALDAEQQIFVTNKDILDAAVMTYAQLKAEEDVAKEQAAAVQAAKDAAAAKAVDEQILSIGEVTAGVDSLTKIETAKLAYANLTDAQKALVENKAILDAAEAKYIELKAQEEAKRLEAEKQAAAEQAAREQAQKDNKAAQAVILQISSIGTVDTSTDCKVKIDVAKLLYTNLTDAQKKLVTNKDILDAAELRYTELKAIEDAQKEEAQAQQAAKEQAQKDAEKAKQEEKAAEEAAKAEKEAAQAGTQSAEETGQTIITANTDKKDIAGSTFAAFRLQAKEGKKSVKLSWNKIEGAEGYIIYGGLCGKKMKLIKEVSASKKSLKIKNLKKGKYYKYMLVACKTICGEKRTFVTSKTVHVCTKDGKFGNPTGISCNTKKITLKTGRNFKIKPTLKYKMNIKTHVAKFRYESANPSVATVSSKGKVKGIAKGECYVYVYTQNGIYKRIKVKVT